MKLTPKLVAIWVVPMVIANTIGYFINAVLGMNIVGILFVLGLHTQIYGTGKHN